MLRGSQLLDFALLILSALIIMVFSRPSSTSNGGPRYGQSGAITVAVTGGETNPGEDRFQVSYRGPSREVAALLGSHVQDSRRQVRMTREQLTGLLAEACKGQKPPDLVIDGFSEQGRLHIDAQRLKQSLEDDPSTACPATFARLEE